MWVFCASRALHQLQVSFCGLLSLLVSLSLNAAPLPVQIQNKSALYGKYEAGNKLDMTQFADQLGAMGLRGGAPGAVIADELFER